MAVKRDADGRVEHQGSHRFPAGRRFARHHEPLPFPVTVHFAILDGRHEPVLLEIGADFDSARDPRPISAAEVRSIPIGEIVAEAGWLLRRYIREIAAGDVEANERTRARARNAQVAVEGTGRLYGIDHWQEVARIYREAMSTRQPTLVVSEHFHVSRSTAAKWVRRCRDLGLLPETTQGKTSAAPKPRGTKGGQHGSK